MPHPALRASALTALLSCPALAAGDLCTLLAEGFDGPQLPGGSTNGTYAIDWCFSGASIDPAPPACLDGSALKLVNGSLWITVEVPLGQNCESVRIDYDFVTSSTFSTGIYGDSTTGDPIECSPFLDYIAGFGLAPSCASGFVELDLNPGTAAQVRIWNSSATPTWVDDVRISLETCDCAGGCVTAFATDFDDATGNASVCDSHPDLFQACFGAFVAPSGPCSDGPGDYSLQFGSQSFPASSATTRCLDLSGAEGAHVTFRYAKTPGTTGPGLELSANGGPFSSIWMAPQTPTPTPAGDCGLQCVDLAPWVGQSDVRLRFTTATTAPNNSDFDDIQLVLAPPPAGSFLAYDVGAAPANTLTLAGGGSPNLGRTLVLSTSTVTGPGALTVLSLAQASVPLGMGQLLVDPGAIFLSDFSTAPFGTAGWSIPIPGDAALIGARLFAQSGAPDPGAPGGTAYSNGLEVVLGCG